MAATQQVRRDAAGILDGLRDLGDGISVFDEPIIRRLVDWQPFFRLRWSPCVPRLSLPGAGTKVSVERSATISARYCGSGATSIRRCARTIGRNPQARREFFRQHTGDASWGREYSGVRAGNAAFFDRVYGCDPGGCHAAPACCFEWCVRGWGFRGCSGNLSAVASGGRGGTHSAEVLVVRFAVTPCGWCHAIIVQVGPAAGQQDMTMAALVILNWSKAEQTCHCLEVAGRTMTTAPVDWISRRLVERIEFKIKRLISGLSRPPATGIKCLLEGARSGRNRSVHRVAQHLEVFSSVPLVWLQVIALGPLVPGFQKDQPMFGLLGETRSIAVLTTFANCSGEASHSTRPFCPDRGVLSQAWIRHGCHSYSTDRSASISGTNRVAEWNEGNPARIATWRLSHLIGCRLDIQGRVRISG